MNITRLNEGAWMSNIVIHGSTVYLSGQIPSDEQGIQAQTKAVLEKVDTALAEVESHRGNLLSATIILADMDDFAAMNLVWEAWLSTYPKPTRACFEGRLADPNWKVEVVVTAALGNSDDSARVSPP